MSIVAQEPLFHGLKPDPSTKSLTPEDFLARVEALSMQNEWDDKKTAAEAIGWLRGDARRWFTALESIEGPEAPGRATASFRHFKRYFKDNFFTVRTVHDLSADWSLIQQKSSERARDFCVRVAGDMHEFAGMAENLEEDLDREHEAFLTSKLDPALSAQDRATWVLEMRRLQKERDNLMQRKGRWLLGSIFAKKLMASGVHDGKVRDLIRQLDQKGKPIKEIVEEVDETERRSKAQALENRNGQRGHNGYKGRVAEVTSQGDAAASEEEEVAAMSNPKKKGKKKKSKSKNGGNGGVPPAQAAPGPQRGGPRQNQAPRSCGFCGEMGHWMRTCPEVARLRMLGQQTATNASVATLQQPRQQQRTTMPGETPSMMPMTYPLGWVPAHLANRPGNE